jgi:hypothetical protein
MLDNAVGVLERDILAGRLRWIADLDETFRNRYVEGQIFELFARGQTRSKGFLLSQFFAWTVLPNYKVSLFAKAVRDRANFLRGNLTELIQLIARNMERNNLKWAWLVLLFEGDPPSRISTLIEEYNRNEIGIASVNTYSGSVLTSNNLLGKALVKHMRLNKLVSEVEDSNRKQGTHS